MTNAQKIGALAAFITAVVGVYLGNRTVSNPTTTRACIPFSGTKPGGLKTTRAVVGLSPKAQTTLGLSPVTDWAYAGVEVQALDGTALPAFAAQVLGEVEILPDLAWDRTVQGPVAASCQVLVVRQDDPATSTDAADVFKCGCYVGSGTCTWTGGACVKGVTFDPGTFSGTGVRRKPCVQLLGQPTTMPVECR